MISSPHLHLDTATLLFVVPLGAAVFGLLFLLNWWQRRSETIFPLWGAANLNCGLGCLLLGLFADQGPNLVTAIANGLLISFFSLMWAGLRRFDARSILWPVVCLVPILVAALFSIPVRGVDLVAWHIYLYSLVSAGFCIACLVECWRGQREEHLLMRWLAMAAFAAAAVVTLLRCGYFLWAGFGGRDLDWLGPAFAVTFLLLFLVWSHAILLMLNERYANRLLDLARRDPLTGVLNRLGFREMAHPEIERCRQSHRQAWLLLFDLDHFKNVNDTYGHEAGDQLLRAFVEVARKTIRTDDLLGRHGGEEFCILFPDCTQGEALAAADRLRRAFEAVFILVHGQQVRTTASAGGAEIRFGKDPLRQAIRRADTALYKAKQQRNRVLLIEEIE